MQKTRRTKSPKILLRSLFLRSTFVCTRHRKEQQMDQLVPLLSLSHTHTRISKALLSPSSIVSIDSLYECNTRT